MNMFKNRRKAKEQSDAFDALVGNTSAPTPHKSSKSLKRKGKTAIEDTKPVFDLSAALPDSDDFRTSLLMPNLSARFSMLREQNDPNSKIGKASDDSVLFPRRSSQLNLFGHNPLSDIAEVESIHSNFRPPFANEDRANSLTDGYDSDGGSMMSRARPGEGNNLFGGRAKVFRIAPNSTKMSGEGSESNTLGGRYLYEGDVSLSLLKQYRLKEREREHERRLSTEKDEPLGQVVTDAGDSDVVSSPATAFSRNRGTQSSTHSGPRRTSTAATSIVSESPVPRNSSGSTPAGSLMAAHESSKNADDKTAQAMSPTARKFWDRPSPPTRQLSPSKSTANIGDKFQRAGGLFNAGVFRNAAQPAAMHNPQPLDFGFGNENKNSTSSDPTRAVSPTPYEVDMLANSVQPNDRGKATAMGLFHKPARAFDEQQFSQRQLQMHEGRMSPMSTESRSASRTSNEAQKGYQSNSSQTMSSSPAPTERDSIPQAPPVPSKSSSPAPSSQRASRASNASSFYGTPSSRPRSKSAASATASANVKARVESLIRRQNAELAAMEAEKLGTPEQSPGGPTLSAEEKEISAGVFPNSEESSDDESEVMVSQKQSRTVSAAIPESEIHPAFRTGTNSVYSSSLDRGSRFSNFSRTRSVAEDDRKEHGQGQIVTPDEEVPKFDGKDGFGLSGMIRTHLRLDSTTSSILPPPSPSLAQLAASEASRTDSLTSASRTTDDGARSEAREAEKNMLSKPTSQLPDEPLTPTTAMSQHAQNMLDQAMAIKEAAGAAAAVATAEGASEDKTDISLSGGKLRSWHDELEPSHRRGESSETTKERREFDEELAERRRRIQEGLKSVVERDRSQSPAATPRGQQFAMQAFVQPRTNTDGPTPRVPSDPRVDDERGRARPVRNGSRNHGGESSLPDSRVTAMYARFQPSEIHEQGGRQRSRTRTEPRDRSNSGTTSRSKSRPRVREDDMHPMPGSFPSETHPSSPPQIDRHGLPSGLSGARGHERLGLASGGPPQNMRRDYFNIPSPVPDLTTGLSARPSPRPSPITPTGPWTDQPQSTVRPSPQTSGFGNGRTTPTAMGRSTPIGTRKRSVTKTMISEPTFVSSTSSVPLIRLPNQQNNSPPSSAPPIPQMNPRRRGTPVGDGATMSLNSPTPRGVGMDAMPESPKPIEFGADHSQPLIKQRNRLRKTSSEGGSMAAKAKHQMLMADMAHERQKSPAVPIFPNRSATAIGLSTEGGMF